MEHREWALCKTLDYELATMLTVPDNGAQADLFLSSEDYDEEVGSYVPKPIAEYKPIEYWRLQCLTT